MFQLAKINKADTENQQADKPQNTDLSAYVLSYTWSGDVEQAGRKLEFDIAYTTKDKNWTNAVLELGDEVCFSYTDEVTQEMFPIFQGRIFSRSRDSESYSMRFVAFDNIIYLAKSRITRKYANVTVADAIRQTIHDFNIEAGTMPDLSVVCSFIADDISATDAIKQALSYQSAQDGKGYHIYMTDGKLNVVCTNDQVVEDFLISDETNLTGASVSESVEDMVSKVVVVDSAGQTKGEITNGTDIERFGTIQAICKADPQQDDASQARAMLKTVAHDMAVKRSAISSVSPAFPWTSRKNSSKGGSSSNRTAIGLKGTGTPWICIWSSTSCWMNRSRNWTVHRTTPIRIMCRLQQPLRAARAGRP